MNLADIVVAIPHASVHIPEEIRPLMQLGEEIIANESDLYTDRIYSVDGARNVIAKHSRVIADVNRAPDEIYTEGPDRALGVVILSQADGNDVFKEDPNLDTLQQWIDAYHKPFHRTLKAEIDTARFVVDAHSMWSVSAPGHYGPTGVERPDINLGNLFFCSCSAEVTDFFRTFFEDCGYSVKINEPYFGRYILGTYCSRLHTPGITIEFNRKLYLNEETLEPYDDVIATLNSQMEDLLTKFCPWFEALGSDREMVDLKMQ